MLYATGGAAYGRLALMVEAYDSFVGPMSFELGQKRFGWAAGLGAEVALTSNTSVKTEYLYTDLGSWTIPDSTGRSEYSFGLHTLRAGVNVAF
jgi:outer membrane immunogenic protein